MLMMKKLLLIVLWSCISGVGFSQSRISENVVLVTMDGLRWQEIFGGADSLLTFDSTASYNKNYVQKSFWGHRRRKEG